MNDATRKLLNLPLTIDPYVIPIIERKEKLASEKQERDEQDEQLDISDIIREETQHGRTIVLFLISAMQGEIDDFEPCHRLTPPGNSSSSATTSLRRSSTHT